MAAYGTLQRFASARALKDHCLFSAQFQHLAALLRVGPGIKILNDLTYLEPGLSNT